MKTKFIILLLLVPVLVRSQNKNCDLWIKASPDTICTISPYLEVNDTLFAVKQDSCSILTFDSGHSGDWRIYSNDTLTIIEESRIIDGKKEGPSIRYYINGQIKEKANFKNNTLHGKYIFYYASGNVLKEGIFENGEFTGIINTYWDNGNIARQVSYKNGTVQHYKKEYGRFWNENGDIINEKDYVKKWFDCF